LKRIKEAQKEEAKRKKERKKEERSQTVGRSFRGIKEERDFHSKKGGLPYVPIGDRKIAKRQNKTKNGFVFFLLPNATERVSEKGNKVKGDLEKKRKKKKEEDQGSLGVI